MFILSVLVGTIMGKKSALTIKMQHDFKFSSILTSVTKDEKNEKNGGLSETTNDTHPINNPKKVSGVKDTVYLDPEIYLGDINHLVLGV